MAQIAEHRLLDLIRIDGSLGAPIAEIEEALEHEGLLPLWLRCVRHIGNKVGLAHEPHEVAARQQLINSLFLDVWRNDLNMDVIEAAENPQFPAAIRV